ncbi:MAG: PH domain-containing protein [Candidatus Hodarchaeota archaeon]
MFPSSVEKGKPFKPESAFRNKLFLYIISIFGLVAITVVAFFGLLLMIITVETDPGKAPSRLETFFQDFGDVIVFGFILLNLAWIIPATILAIYYVRAIEYTLDDTEVIVRKGIINKTVKHVPFRTITNISSRYGIYDRILRIGTVEIETAGKSGQQTEPEAKIEGIHNFIDVRDFVLNSLRGFSTTYTTTTEVELPQDSVNIDMEFYKELLITLNEIKEILLE